MITSAAEYLAHIQEIRNQNIHPQERLHIPDSEKIYEIDLNKRSIETPTFLSVETDHTAETIFFKVDRFYDNIDLTDSTCVIQYVNARGKTYLYVVPIFDIQSEEGKIIFPWVIQGPATIAAGTIKYAVRFYKVKEGPVDIEGKPTYTFDYILNTTPATSRILNGMGAGIYTAEKALEGQVQIEIGTDDNIQVVTYLESILARLDNLENSDGFNVYWIDLFD
jgi:hypothetical protein